MIFEFIFFFLRILHKIFIAPLIPEMFAFYIPQEKHLLFVLVLLNFFNKS